MKNLEIFNGKVVCPRCDGNGLIYKVKVVDIDICLFTCDECDATWENSEEIDIKTFKDFQTYLQIHGSKYTSSNLIDLGYDWFEIR